MTNFDRAFDLVVQSEGKLSLDRNDPGNWTGGSIGVGTLDGTWRGISAPVARSNGWTGSMDQLPDDLVRKIYKEQYWDVCRCDELPWKWALALFDGAVQHGPVVARKYAQEALQTVSDGVLGSNTMKAFALSTDWHVARFFALRAILYFHNPQFQADGMGWLTRIFLRAFEAAQ